MGIDTLHAYRIDLDLNWGFRCVWWHLFMSGQAFGIPFIAKIGVQHWQYWYRQSSVLNNITAHVTD